MFDFIKMIVAFIVLCVLIVKFPSIVGFSKRLCLFIKWKYKDIKNMKNNKDRFKYFGLKMFTGRQGSGKTVGMVYYLEQIRKRYPKAIIVTNFDYKYQHYPLKSLNDILQIRNGELGVVFAIDELQNEFSCLQSKDFPESLLSQVTQQRKQRICILASSQVFTRVAKPLREQCYEVIDCRTLAGRWTRLRCYDGDDYNKIIENPDPKVKFKTPKKWKQSFIQTDALRLLYDTYAVVARISRDGFKAKITNS